MSTIRKIAIVGLLLTEFLPARVGFVIAVAQANGDAHSGVTATADHITSGGGSSSCTTAALTVTVNVVNTGGGTKSASDFTVTVSGTNPSPSTFPGSASGTKVSIGLGTYEVGQAADPDYTTSLSADCSGVMAKGNTKTCTITDTFIPPPPTTGSITVCKAIVNASGTIVDGSAFAGQTFTVPGLASVPSTTAAAAGLLTTTVFVTPLSLNAELFGASAANAQCTIYGNLALGHYYYGEEQIASSTSMWAAPVYSDQDTVTASTPSDFFPYSGQLFDNDSSNDGERNTNADGDIYLTASRPVRELIVLNQLPGETPTSTPTSTPSSTVPSADISITKTADVTSTMEGGTVNYVLTVSASGPATSTGVTATDILHSGLTFVNATSSEGEYASSTGIWNIGDMPVSSTASLIIAATVDANATGMIANTATVGENASTTDPDPANNSSTVSIAIATSTCTTDCGGGTPTSTPTSTISNADIAITKTVDNANPNGGDTINYTLTVTALGPATSTFVKANDLLPLGLSLVSATSSQGLYNMSTGDWDIGTLDPNATVTLVIAAMVDSREAGQTITNTATVSELDSLVDSSANNSSSVSIAVQAPPCTSNCGGNGGGGGGGGGGSGITVLTGGGGSAYNIAINGGATSTATTSVTLSLYGTEAYTMELSNTPDFASSTWEPYVTTKSWVLTSGAGSKTVYVKYRSIGGSALGSAQDSIELLGQAPAGQVLGTATSCGIYLNEYIKLGAKNNPDEVKKLQAFLNQNLGINLPVTGYYGPLTYNAVKQFQLKYNGNVLAPWVPYGLENDMTATGYVYKTTQRWINMLMCSALNLPIPPLP